MSFISVTPAPTKSTTSKPQVKDANLTEILPQGTTKNAKKPTTDKESKMSTIVSIETTETRKQMAVTTEAQAVGTSKISTNSPTMAEKTTTSEPRKTTLVVLSHSSPFKDNAGVSVSRGSTVSTRESTHKSHCPMADVYGIQWPMAGGGELVSKQCKNGKGICVLSLSIVETLNFILHKVVEVLSYDLFNVKDYCPQSFLCIYICKYFEDFHMHFINKGRIYNNKECYNDFTGRATWRCGSDPVEWVGEPDVSGCASESFTELLSSVKNLLCK